MKKVFFIIMSVLLIFAACNQTENNSESETAVTEVKPFSDVDQTAIDRINQIYNEYIGLKDALVQSDAVKASESASLLAQAAREFNFEPLQPEARVFLEENIATIEERSEAIASSSGIEQQREYFYPLSQQMYQIMKAFVVRTEAVYYQYCPMAFDDAGAYWLSNEKNIRNPYFGDRMLKCGEVKEVFK